jgi:hypothetical protein
VGKVVGELISELTPKDFEIMVDFILARTGWTRLSAVGGPQEDIDIAAENLAVGDIQLPRVPPVGA